MSRSEMLEFMNTQVRWIEVARWYEGQRLGKDPGSDFDREWVRLHGAEFRQWWNDNHKE